MQLRKPTLVPDRPDGRLSPIGTAPTELALSQLSGPLRTASIGPCCPEWMRSGRRNGHLWRSASAVDDVVMSRRVHRHGAARHRHVSDGRGARLQRLAAGGACGRGRPARSAAPPGGPRTRPYRVRIRVQNLTAVRPSGSPSVVRADWNASGCRRNPSAPAIVGASVPYRKSRLIPHVQQLIRLSSTADKI